MKSDVLYFDRMRDAIRKIESFTADMKAEDFASDEKTQSAVILQLMLIGEMAKRVSAQAKASTKLP